MNQGDIDKTGGVTAAKWIEWEFVDEQTLKHQSRVRESWKKPSVGG